jgi:hypothetical protein
MKKSSVKEHKEFVHPSSQNSTQNTPTKQNTKRRHGRKQLEKAHKSKRGFQYKRRDISPRNGHKNQPKSQQTQRFIHLEFAGFAQNQFRFERRVWRHIQTRIGVKEVAGFEAETDILARHDGPILGTRHVGDAKIVPNHYIALTQRTTLTNPGHQTLAAGTLIGVVTAWVQLL